MEKKLRQGSLCVQAGYKAKNGEPIELPITAYKLATKPKTENR